MGIEKNDSHHLIINYLLSDSIVIFRNFTLNDQGLEKKYKNDLSISVIKLDLFKQKK